MKKFFIVVLITIICVTGIYLFITYRNKQHKDTTSKDLPKKEITQKIDKEVNPSLSVASKHTVSTPISKGEIIKHKYYTLSYNENAEQANWVFYKLTASMIKGSTKRSDKFISDPYVSTYSASPDDYKHSGYDRGHLCPAADMRFSSTAMQETFYMSNMSPQEPEFNRGIWKKLEEQVRKWAVKEDSLYIISGPVLSKEYTKTIGQNSVIVPKYYYKVIYAPGKRKKMIAFLLKNEKGTSPLYKYAVSTDSIESLTGINFFPNLENEEILENQYNYSLWK